jgi:hypothetical protein
VNHQRPVTPSGEPVAGSEPGATDTAGDEVLVDPGSAGDTPDPEVSGPTAVTPAETG